tara:strand:+ start:241974 stop:242492 length:519 start_codon:yes stop_codon:yes gene_type:complete
VAAWIHVGLTSVLHRIKDIEACESHLRQARHGAERAGPAAILEVSLLRARIATDVGNRALANELFATSDALLATRELSRQNALSYRARLVGQRAYHLTEPLAGETANFSYARSLFDELEEGSCAPFACFRRNSGLAYCTWQLGDTAEGVHLAKRAAEYAGDGGLVRFRIMAR